MEGAWTACGEEETASWVWKGPFFPDKFKKQDLQTESLHLVKGLMSGKGIFPFLPGTGCWYSRSTQDSVRHLLPSAVSQNKLAWGAHWIGGPMWHPPLPFHLCRKPHLCSVQWQMPSHYSRWPSTITSPAWLRHLLWLMCRNAGSRLHFQFLTCLVSQIYCIFLGNMRIWKTIYKIQRIK